MAASLGFRLFISGLLLHGLLSSPAFAANEPAVAPAVKVVEVSWQERYQAPRRFSGRVIGSQRAELGFELAGRVESHSLKAGDSVAAGDRLLSLDTRALKVEQRELEAEAEEILAQIERVELSLSRQRRLDSQGHAVRQTIDELAAERRGLRARLSRNQARQDGVALRIDQSTLTAPFGGEIQWLAAEQGMIVRAGEPLLRLVETASSEAVFGIPRHLRDSVAAGDGVQVYGHFGRVEAIVLTVARGVDPGTLTHAVRVALPPAVTAADSAIAYLELTETREDKGFWLPLEALLEGMRGTWAVYALDDDGRLQKRAVVPVYQLQDKVFVRATLVDGDAVVAAGVHRLAPGQRVVIAGEVAGGKVSR